MTDLTPRQILDAIRRGLEETWRQIDEEASKHPQTHERTDEFAETERQSGVKS
jgi:hypothetical protein